MLLKDGILCIYICYFTVHIQCEYTVGLLLPSSPPHNQGVRCSIKLTDSRPSPTCVAAELSLPPPSYIVLCFGALKTSSSAKGEDAQGLGMQKAAMGHWRDWRGWRFGDRLDGLSAIGAAKLAVRRSCVLMTSHAASYKRVSFLKRPEATAAHSTQWRILYPESPRDHYTPGHRRRHRVYTCFPIYRVYTRFLA